MRYKKLKKIREENNRMLMNQTERIHKLEKQVKELTNILVEANIIEDVDMTDVKYRDKEIEYAGGLFGPHTFTVKTPYIVNEAKVK